MAVLSAAPAQAAAGAEQVAAAARPCGESTGDKILYIAVYYRHCTSGSDSVRVKAIINNGSDGSCTTVNAGKTEEIAGYVWPSSFDRIVRC
jgi:hypothetical protein